MSSTLPPLLSIVCHTFNQEKYLEETIKGFLLQKTNFLFEIIIHDDASTDGTSEIIKKYENLYPNQVKSILQTENKYSKNCNIWSEFTFPTAKGKYIAICEGDDYWTDENKLQKQVDFLEKNQEYVVCWTDYLNFNGTDFTENNFKISQQIFKIDFDNLYHPYCTLSLTTVFKKEAIDMQLLSGLTHFKDNSLYMILLRKGFGAFINEKTAVYRIHVGGVYSMKSLFFRRYSSYLNVKEMYDAIPESRTKNIEKTINSLLRNSAFEALKIKYNSTDKLTLDEETALKLFFPKAKLSVKLKYFKRIIQYSLKKTFKK